MKYNTLEARLRSKQPITLSDVLSHIDVSDVLNTLEQRRIQIEDIVALTISRDGKLEVRSSFGDPDKIIAMLTKATMLMVNNEGEPEDENDGEEIVS